MEKQRMFSLKFSTTSLSPENEPAAIEMKVMRILDDVAKCISEGQLQGAVRDGIWRRGATQHRRSRCEHG
jgi:hypothetical protein